MQAVRMTFVGVNISISIYRNPFTIACRLVIIFRSKRHLFLNGRKHSYAYAFYDSFVDGF